MKRLRRMEMTELRAAPVRSADGEDIGIAVGNLDENGEVTEARVLSLAAAVKFRAALEAILDEIADRDPVRASELVRREACERAECEGCAPLMEYLARIMELSGICPSHGVALADGLGCPVCEVEMTGQTS